MPGTSGLRHAGDSRQRRDGHPHAEHALGETLVRQALDAARGYILKNALVRIRPPSRASPPADRGGSAPTASRLPGERSRLTPRELNSQLICNAVELGDAARLISASTLSPSTSEHHDALAAQDRGARGLAIQHVGQPVVNRRQFRAVRCEPRRVRGSARSVRARRLAPGFRLVDVTGAAGSPSATTTAPTERLLPETLGSGWAFLDYDADGWQDVILINGMDPAGQKRQRSTLRLYRNNRNGTFTDVTRAAGLDVEIYGMGVAAGDFDNDGFVDLLVTCVGQSRLFRNTGKGAFVDVTKASGLGGREAFSTSAMWVDVDRDGLLDLFICNYVRWSAEHDVFCSLDGKQKAYCTPEAYRGDTCWLYRNRGNGTFEDHRDLQDLRLELEIAGVTHRRRSRRLARHLRHQRHAAEQAVSQSAERHLQGRRAQAGVALSDGSETQAGAGIDVGDAVSFGARASRSRTSRARWPASTSRRARTLPGLAMRAGIGAASETCSGFGCAFADLDLMGRWIVVVNGRIDDTVRNIRGSIGHAQPPLLFLNDGRSRFRDVAAAVGSGFARSREWDADSCGIRRRWRRRPADHGWRRRQVTSATTSPRATQCASAGRHRSRPRRDWATVQVFHGGHRDRAWCKRIGYLSVGAARGVRLGARSDRPWSSRGQRCDARSGCRDGHL